VTDDVREAPHRRGRLDERSHDRLIWGGLKLTLPAQDGSRGHAEHARRLVRRQGEKRPDPEDAEAGVRLIVGTLALGELVPPDGEDVGCLSEEGGVERLLLQLREAVEVRGGQGRLRLSRAR
jgi:hypothetical protein